MKSFQKPLTKFYQKYYPTRSIFNKRWEFFHPNPIDGNSTPCHLLKYHNMPSLTLENYFENYTESPWLHAVVTMYILNKCIGKSEDYTFCMF